MFACVSSSDDNTRIVNDQLIREFDRAAHSGDQDLAASALAIARIEYPRLVSEPYIRRLDRLGEHARARLAFQAGAGRLRLRDRLAVLNEYLFDEIRFRSSPEERDDPRHHLLNEVLDRRAGGAIGLGVLYLEVARRAGIRVEAVDAHPHFLLRAPQGATREIVLDPFDAGAFVSPDRYRALVGHRPRAGERRRPLQPASKQQVLVRMLLELKHVYIRLRSFPQARQVAHLLLAVDRSALTELRDRGLIAYHLEDFTGMREDLETFLTLSSGNRAARRGEREQIWEHVRTLRRRAAALN